MVQIDNDTLLTKILIQDMSKIIEKVSEELLNDLVKDGGLIDLIVYQAGQPKEYDRQGKMGGLWGMWDKEPLKVSENKIISVVQEYPNRLNWDTSLFIHGSVYWKRDDVRDILVDIITQYESRHMAGPLFGEGYWRLPRDFWTPFLKKINDGTISKMIEKEFNLMGIEYNKVF